MKNIKNIVVPVDFSSTSRNAYQYARNLARTLDAIVTVVNIKEDLIVIASDVMISPVLINDTQSTKELEKFIIEEDEKLNADLLQSKAIAKHLNGDAISVLVDVSEDETTDLIIMGSSGLQDFLTKITGSVSSKVSNKAHCPVILVPRNVKWHPITNIVYASNYDSLQQESLLQISSFAHSVNAQVHFVNVRNYDPLFETKQKDIDWEKLNELNTSSLKFNKHTIYGNDTAKELTAYVEKNNVDIISILTKHRNFWQSLTHKSVTEAIASTSTIPLLIVHVEDGV